MDPVRKIEILCQMTEHKIASHHAAVLRTMGDVHTCEGACDEHVRVIAVTRLLYGKQMWYMDLRLAVTGTPPCEIAETPEMKIAREKCTRGWVTRNTPEGSYPDFFEVEELAPINNLIAAYPKYKTCFVDTNDGFYDITIPDDIIFIQMLIEELGKLAAVAKGSTAPKASTAQKAQKKRR